MTLWGSIYFNDASSPIMEQMIYFHDHSMIILFSVMTFIMYINISILTSKSFDLFLLNENLVEIIWTIIPAILLLFIAFPSLRLLYLMEEIFMPSITIKIMGHQWYWSYQLSDFNISFDSFMIPTNDLEKLDFRLLEVDNKLIIPNNMVIRLIISSDDVIHSWTVPSMGIKIDAIPGRLNQLMMMSFQVGLFFGQCSEICGINHSFMPIIIEAKTLNFFLKGIF